MVDTNPACTDDERFIDDQQPADALAPICATCPLFGPCSEYGNLERPKAGVWAGKRYRTNQPRKPGGVG